MSLERKTREAEQLTARLVDESERRATEANKLKEELLRARVAEKQAKEKLLEFLSRNAYNNINTVSNEDNKILFFPLSSSQIFSVCLHLFLISLCLGLQHSLSTSSSKIIFFFFCLFLILCHSTHVTCS